MSKLVVSTIGPASSVQDGGRYGAQRYGLTPSGAMDRLALAAANTLVGNAPFTAAIEIGPFGAAFTAREGAVRVALAGAPRSADIAGRAVACEASMTVAEGETLTLGFARSGAFTYLAIEGGIMGEPMFGSLAVTRAPGLAVPIHARCRRVTNCRPRPQVAPPSTGSIFLPWKAAQSAW
jgi:allophanate hydrolase subunit 2